MMKVFPHGRWDREQPHVLEKVWDPSNGAEWAQCSCGWQGGLTQQPGKADADAEEHEKFVFLVRKAGFRMVRGGIE